MKTGLIVAVVEDDESSREMVKAAFLEEGFIVHTAGTIKEALAAFARAA